MSVPQTADEALDRAREYANGERSDSWNQMIESTDGESRIAGIAAVSVEDSSRAVAWSAISIAMRAKETAA